MWAEGLYLRLKERGGVYTHMGQSNPVFARFSTEGLRCNLLQRWRNQNALDPKVKAQNLYLAGLSLRNQP
jgi:hypothetical protein